MTIYELGAFVVAGFGIYLSFRFARVDEFLTWVFIKALLAWVFVGMMWPFALIVFLWLMLRVLIEENRRL